MVVTGSAERIFVGPDTEAVETELRPPAPGERRRTGRGHIDSFGEGRICAVAGCSTALSRYNPSVACWLHDDSVMPAARWAR